MRPPFLRPRPTEFIRSLSTEPIRPLSTASLLPLSTPSFFPLSTESPLSTASLLPVSTDSALPHPTQFLLPPSIGSLLPPPTKLNDAHKVWGVFIFIVIFLVIATSIASLRLVLRWKTGSFGLDDWVTIPALIAYIAHSIMAAYVNANAGLGKPLWEVTIPEFEIWGKGHIATCFLYPITSGLIRTSILLLYDRVFSETSRTMKLIIRFSIVFVWCCVVGIVIYSGFLCRPLNKFWKPFDRPKYCGSELAYWKYTAVVYALSLCQDIGLLFLPIIPVWRLRMSPRKRAELTVVFFLGSSACVAAAYKLAVFGMQWGRRGQVDPRWINTQASRVIPPQFDGFGYTMWMPTQAELSAAMIGCSLVPLKAQASAFALKISSVVRYTLTSKLGSGASKSDNYDSLGKDAPAQKGIYRGDSSVAINTDVELASHEYVGH